MTDRGRQTLPLSFNVNGSRYDIEVEPHELLLDVIRKRLGLTGSKRSCDVQVCGACTVLLNGRPVSSCTLPAFEARDKDVLTIEGMAKDGKLHPIQEAFIEYGGFQCGFCTPGMILTADDPARRESEPTEEEVIEYMNGNICRCTGYKKIVESIMAVGKGGAEAS